MRGDDQQQDGMFSYISPNKRVPQEHPLRRIRSIVDRVLDQLSPRFNKLYARAGRPSIAPEKLLRALLLQLLYSVRSERLLMEQLDYNLLFRWFVGLSMDDAVWDASTFSKNRERMLEGDIAEAFFQWVLGEARAGQLLSDKHFRVDGTLLEAWASHKSFRPVDPVGKDNDQEPKPPAARWDKNNPTVNYRGEKRTNQTHCSTTDPQAMLARKGPGKEAKLSYHGHLMTENRSGLVVNTQVTTAYGSAECHAGLLMAEQLPGCGRVTLGADKGYDQREFVEELRCMGVTPHVAQNQGRRRSRLDQRTTLDEILGGALTSTPMIPQSTNNQTISDFVHAVVRAINPKIAHRSQPLPTVVRTNLIALRTMIAMTAAPIP